MATSTPNITVISGPQTPGTIDDHELFFARRALKLLKERLGSDGLKKLLAEDIAAANTLYTTLPQSYTPISITLRTHGISSSELLAWFHRNTSSLPVMLAAHPEHYINGHEVLETVGTHVSLFDLKFYPDGPPSFVGEALREEGRYPVVLAAAGVLQAGKREGKETIVGYACHQFRDLHPGELEEGETKGVEAKLGGCMPEGLGEEVLEMQTRHLLVEWRDWMRKAALEQREIDAGRK